MAPIIAHLPEAEKVTLDTIMCKLRNRPVFGGTSPEGGAAGGAPAGGAPAGGGGTGNGTDDAIKKLQEDPNALAALLGNVNTLTAQVGTMQTELDGYKQKETDAENAKKTTEQQQADKITGLEAKLDAEVAKRDNIITAKLIENAILANPEYQWNSLRQVNAELAPLMDQLEINVDIDKGIAEIKGMDAVLKKIATDSPWLVKATTTQQQQQPAGPTRPSGAAPRPPAPTGGSKEERHARAMKTFPTVALAANGR